MGIFRRSPDTAPAITRFWEWWTAARQRIEAALGNGIPEELAAEITQRVEAIHPKLGWDISRSGEAPSLTVSGDGKAELRGITERWRRAAPDAAAGWAFHAAFPADPDMLAHKLHLNDHEFDLAFVALGLHADPRRARVDVTVYHPDFLFVAEEASLQVALRVLNWALGEDDVARWVGTVAIATDKPVDALPPGMLPSVVEQISAPFSEPAWLTGEGLTPLRHPARVAVRFPLHRQDHPLCDLHVAIALPYAHSNPDRLPVEPSASALREFETILGGLSDRSVLAAHETGDGRRVFHLYAAPDSGIVADLDQLAAGWTEGRAKVAAEPDPGWEALAPYQP